MIDDFVLYHVIRPTAAVMLRQMYNCEQIVGKGAAEITEVSAAIIYDSDGSILICRRGEGGNCAGLWEFPGGKREAGETMEECLVRECREELDIVIGIDSLYEEFVYDYPDRTIRFAFFEARIISGTPRTNVHSDMRWVTRRGLADFDFCTADAGLVERLSRDI